ncbi:MAG: hypothetical protein HOP11_09215 [Saprospiraceae bacterium]|nr:hypothetical protein [Saprospiraceae bacterium]
MVCDESPSCCNFNASCCSSRQNLVRSSYSTSRAYVDAIACELEKVLQGCIEPQYQLGCFEDKFCFGMKNITNGNINAAYGTGTTLVFDYCTHNTSVNPYFCGGNRYNVDIPISVQNLMASFIRDQFNDPNAPQCPSGYTRSIHKINIRVCHDESINCVEFPDCSNMFLSAEFTYKCCPQ